MKKSVFLSMAAATVMLAACATDDDKNGTNSAEGQSKYLAVNIMNVGATPHRQPCRRRL